VIEPNFSYTYDGRKQKLTEGGSAVNGDQTFGYDGQGRLTTWASGSSTQTWTLAKVGDWQTTSRNGLVEARTHDAAHELTSVVGIPLTYDGRGNLATDDIGHSLSWDFDNRLTSHVLNETGHGASYLSDVLGRKVGRNTGSSRTVIVYADQEAIAEYQDGTLRTAYVLGAAIDQPLCFISNGTVNWYSANQNGSIMSVTDGSGAVLERYRYDAYGAQTVLTPSGDLRSGTFVGNHLGFTGRFHDDVTGLIDFRARQYDPRLGRFISRDDD
jgi:RHS repeat-associated protein